MANYRYTLICTSGSWRTTIKGETGEVSDELAENPTKVAACLLNGLSQEDDKSVQNAEKISFSFSLIKRRSPQKVKRKRARKPARKNP